MPTLEFKGKQFVYSHHLGVPFRELQVEEDKSLPIKGQQPSLDDNLIIHGDNLEALKALLPTHAGKIDCIFIDPPYNTGNEGWCYNDNVRSPLMKEWLKKSANPVDKEDLERHDKWLCMMWPRLNLLKELLSESGSLWVTCDDNEVHRLSQILDEIFGEDAFVANIVVENNRKGRNDKEHVALTHEYMLVYSNDEYLSRGLELTPEQIAEFSQIGDDGRRYALRDLRKRGSEDRKEDRESMFFPIYWDEGTGELSLEDTEGKLTKILPKRGDNSDGRWRWGVERVRRNLSDLVARRSKSGRTDVEYKVFLDEADDVKTGTRKKPKSVWVGPEYSTDHASTLIKEIFGENPLKHSPKPLAQVIQTIQLSVGKNGVVLDSFAGSGTTAHAVLEANKRDGGQRRFILVECEDYADSLTAERVRRVINGYPYTGTQRDELHRENITWSTFEKKHSKVLDHVASIENLQGHEYDKISKQIKDGVLTVTGERKVKGTAPGLGGSFTYCTLGEPIDVESLLTGKGLPNFEALARYVFYTATGHSLAKVGEPAPDGFIGETDLFRVHLFYQPDREWLRSNEAALNAERVTAIEKNSKTGKRAIVFAVAKFMSQKELTARRIEFCQLPYAVHRILGD